LLFHCTSAGLAFEHTGPIGGVYQRLGDVPTSLGPLQAVLAASQ